MCSVACALSSTSPSPVRSLCTYLGSFRALSCNTFAAFSWPSFSFFFAFLSLPFLSSLVAAGAGKTLIFQFVAEFLVIFLLPQFGARSVAVVFPSRFVPLPSSSLLCSCLLCVLVCLVLLLSHLCSAINFTWPPTRERVTRQQQLSLSFSLSHSVSVSISLSLLLLASCGLRFVVCYLFLFSMRSLLFALPIMRCTHTQGHPQIRTQSAFTNTAARTCIHSYTFTCVPPSVLSFVLPLLCLFSNLCLSICSRLSLLPLSFHFVCFYGLLLLLLFLFALRLWLA